VLCFRAGSHSTECLLFQRATGTLFQRCRGLARVRIERMFGNSQTSVVSSSAAGAMPVLAPAPDASGPVPARQALNHWSEHYPFGCLKSGVVNPADLTPCLSGTPSQDAIQDDARSAGQRNHDALNAGY
jgi:hypothetical protein